MSFEAMAMAVKEKRPKQLGRHILLILANYADEKGECWPSLSHIADMVGCTKKAVRDHVVKLEEMGIITRIQRQKNGRHIASKFRLTLSGIPRIPLTSETPENTGVENGGGNPSTPLAEGSPSYTHGSPTVTTSGIPRIPNTITKDTITNTITKERDLPLGLNVESFDEFIQYRSEIKKPIKNATQLKLAEKLANQPTLVQKGLIDLTITNGWVGIQFDRVREITQGLSPNVVAGGSHQSVQPSGDLRNRTTGELVNDRSWA